eukprot:g4276.t1
MFWIMKYYNHPDVKILDGGLSAWERSRYPLNNQPENRVESSYSVSATNPDFLVDFDFVSDNLSNTSVKVVDGRPFDQYTGDSAGKVFHTGVEHQRIGHIYGAESVPWADNLRADGTFKPPEELAEIYAKHHILNQGTVVTYCNEGLHAAMPWFVLHELLGFDDVRLYDDSMAEWANVFDTPMITVFITTEGPGYGGLMSGVTLPGVAIYDADTREVVAQQTYDVLSWGWKNVFEPHGLGTSPDGKWIYLATGEGAILTTGEHAGRFIVINAQTLKVEKVIKLRGQAHHASSYVTPEGEQRVMLYGWSQPLLVVDPDDDHRVVGSMTEQEQGSEAYLYFASPDGSQIMGTGRYRSFDMRKHLDDNPLLIIDTSSWTIKKWVHGNDSAPVWIAYSSDNKYAYVSGAKHSIVMKLDLDEEKVVTEQRAGVDGPYGIHLGWDDQFIYTVGKGEESHNRGKMLGMVDAYTMEAPNSRAMDQFYTGCIRGDHGTLHPDPEANELWVTCNASFEIAIFDLDLRQVTARLPTPNGGSTHSGAFVTYPNGWDGPEGDLGVGPYIRGATEGAIRAAIEGIDTMIVVKTTIDEQGIKDIAEYIGSLGETQIVRTLAKKGRFLPNEVTVAPGSKLQIAVQNASFQPRAFASDDFELDGGLDIAARTIGVLSWTSPDEGEYRLWCDNCDLDDQFFTLLVVYMATYTGISAQQLQNNESSTAVIKRKMFSIAIAFVLGFVGLFMLTGAAIGYAGKEMQMFFAVWSSRLSVLAGLVVIAAGIWIGIRARAPLVCKLVPERLTNLGSSDSSAWIGSAVTAIGFSLGCLTCFGGAIIATLLVYVGALGSAFVGAMVMLAFSLGVVIPFLLGAYFLSRITPLIVGIEKFAPMIAFFSMLVIVAFGLVLVTDNFHVLSDFIYPYLGLNQ